MSETSTWRGTCIHAHLFQTLVQFWTLVQMRRLLATGQRFCSSSLSCLQIAATHAHALTNRVRLNSAVLTFKEIVPAFGTHVHKVAVVTATDPVYRDLTW